MLRAEIELRYVEEVLVIIPKNVKPVLAQQPNGESDHTVFYGNVL